MDAILAILLVVLLFFIVYALIIHPILLFFLCLFDARTSRTYKFTVFVTTFFLFPIPSYIYGAFVRGGGFNMAMAAITGLVLLMSVTASLIGFMLGDTQVLQRLAGTYGMMAAETIGVDVEKYTKKQEKPIYVYRGANTYSTGDVNVFESGRGAEKRPEVVPPPTPLASTSLEEACKGAASTRMTPENCKCIADNFETHPSIKSLMLGKGLQHKNAVRGSIINFFDSIKYKDAAYQKEVREKKNTDPVIGDASKSLGLLFKQCQVKTR